MLFFEHFAILVINTLFEEPFFILTNYFANLKLVLYNVSVIELGLSLLKCRGATIFFKKQKNTSKGGGYFAIIKILGMMDSSVIEKKIN